MSEVLQTHTHDENAEQSATTVPCADLVSPHAEAPAEHHIDPPGSGRTIGLIFVFVLLGAIVYGIYARHTREHELAEKTVEESVPTVSVVQPTSGSAALELTLPGNVQAYTETPIYSRTNGYLRKWFYDIGAHVKKGDLLAVIETPEVDQQLLQSRSELNRMEANAELAGTTSDRWQSLLAKHAVSQQEADQARSNYIAAQAAVDASRANVRRLEELQSYEHIVAPFDGVITARNTDIGDLINAGSSSSGSARELFHLAAAGKMRVFAAVPESFADRIHDGATATVTQESNPGHPLEGTIVRNAKAIDRTTRTLNVEVDVANNDGTLLPGAYVFVHFRTGGSESNFTIPSNTLLFRSEGARVAVVRNGRVHLQPVVLGHDYGDRVEVISGVTASDTIILDPPDSLAENAEVQVKQPHRGNAQ
jgi:RND family efflux transporter MFP subunit